MRAAPGEGSVKKHGKGFRLVVTKDGQQIAGPTVQRRSEARKAFEEKHKAPRSTSDAMILKDSFQQLQSSPWWMALSPTTQETHKGAFKSFLATYGNLRPQNVSNEILEAHKASISTGLQPRTINRNMAGVQVILSKMGIKLEHVKPTKIHGKRAMWLTPDQTKAFLELTKSFPEYLRISCLLALRAGLRRGEICAVCHEDVEEGGINVSRNAVAGLGSIVIKHPKSHRGGGWVPLHTDLKQIIGHGRGLLIKTSTGKIIRPDNLSRALRSNTKGTAFDGIGFHDLRRTFAMSLIESGTDIVTAAEITRHDPRVLLAEYTKSRRSLKVDAMARLETQSTNESTKKRKSGSKSS